MVTEAMFESQESWRLGSARKAVLLALKFRLDVNSEKWNTKAKRGFWRTPNVGEQMRQFSSYKALLGDLRRTEV